MLHRLVELDRLVRKGYDDFDFKRISRHLIDFANIELSAFYFDVRKDALYCDAPSSPRRKAALQVIRQIFDCLVTWLAPMLPFTMEEAWLSREPEAVSVHLEQFPDLPADWRDDALAAKWKKIRTVRRVVTGALEVERREKRIGSSLEAAPVVHIADPDLREALAGRDFAEICITSDIEIVEGEGPADAFRLDDVKSVAVVPALAEGTEMRPFVADHRRRRFRSGVPGRVGAGCCRTARTARARPALNDILAAADCGSGIVSLEAVKKWPELSARGPEGALHANAPAGRERLNDRDATFSLCNDFGRPGCGCGDAFGLHG